MSPDLGQSYSEPLSPTPQAQYTGANQGPLPYPDYLTFRECLVPGQGRLARHAQSESCPVPVTCP